MTTQELHNLRALKVLGSGAMGTVFLVYNHLTDPSAHFKFALKVLHKSCSDQRRARWEVSLLQQFNNKPHPFLPSLIGSPFETQKLLGWATPFCPGGDLNVLRRAQTDGVFSPAVIRFYLAEIVCSLQQLHSIGIVYRDLKPENVLIQNSGHVTLTDFDLSRPLAPKSLKSLILLSEPPEIKKPNRLKQVVMGPGFVKLRKAKSARVTPMTRGKESFSNAERSNSFVGTDEYVAPEMVRGDGHDFAIDWWALGILAYELLYGTTPFRGSNRKDTFERIRLMPVKFTGKPTPLTDLITKLLHKQPTRRLGYDRGACEIQEHQFFSGLKWDLLTEVVRPPFIPSRDDVEGIANSFTITEYFDRLRQTRSSLDSSSRDGCGNNVSFTEF